MKSDDLYKKNFMYLYENKYNKNIINNIPIDKYDELKEDIIRWKIISQISVEYFPNTHISELDNDQLKIINNSYKETQKKESEFLKNTKKNFEERFTNKLPENVFNSDNSLNVDLLGYTDKTIPLYENNENSNMNGKNAININALSKTKYRIYKESENGNVVHEDVIINDNKKEKNNNKRDNETNDSDDDF